MKIEWIRCFIEIDSTCSINKAAMNLYLSQPAVSKMIRALETEIGETLLERSKTGVRLTKHGSLFLPYAKNILNTYETYLAQKTAYNNSVYEFAGTVKLAIAPCLLQTYFDVISKNIKNKFPNLDLCFTETNINVANQLISSDKRILGLVLSAYNIQHLIPKTIVAEELYRSPIIICTGKGSKYAKLKLTDITDIAHKDRITISFELLNMDSEGLFNLSTVNLDVIKQRMMSNKNVCVMMPKFIADKKMDLSQIIQLHSPNEMMALVDFVYHQSVIEEKIYTEAFLQAFKQALYDSLFI